MTKLDRLIRRFNKQVAEIQPEGYVLQGSVVKRYLQWPDGDDSKTYGPYYLWTRKINNKTVTRALTTEQAQVIKEAIQRNRHIEQRIARLRKTSEQIILAITPCVVKRNRLLSCS